MSLLAMIALLALGGLSDPPLRDGYLDRPAEATAQAVRLDPPAPTTTVAPAPAGLWGRPFAPPGLSNCAEASFYRQQWGLPSTFDGLIWRESNCRNEASVRTYCCYGYLQLYFAQHVADARMAPRYRECGVLSPDDYNSEEPIEKQRQLCAARALYDTVGLSAWGR